MSECSYKRALLALLPVALLRDNPQFALDGIVSIAAAALKTDDPCRCDADVSVAMRRDA